MKEDQTIMEMTTEKSRETEDIGDAFQAAIEAFGDDDEDTGMALIAEILGLPADPQAQPEMARE